MQVTPAELPVAGFPSTRTDTVPSALRTCHLSVTAPPVRQVVGLTDAVMVNEGGAVVVSLIEAQSDVAAALPAFVAWTYRV